LSSGANLEMDSKLHPLLPKDRKDPERRVASTLVVLLRRINMGMVSSNDFGNLLDYPKRYVVGLQPTTDREESRTKCVPFCLRVEKPRMGVSILPWRGTQVAEGDGLLNR